MGPFRPPRFGSNISPAASESASLTRSSVGNLLPHCICNTNELQSALPSQTAEIELGGIRPGRHRRDRKGWGYRLLLSGRVKTPRTDVADRFRGIRRSLWDDVPPGAEQTHALSHRDHFSSPFSFSRATLPGAHESCPIPPDVRRRYCSRARYLKPGICLACRIVVVKLISVQRPGAQRGIEREGRQGDRITILNDIDVYGAIRPLALEKYRRLSHARYLHRMHL